MDKTYSFSAPGRTEISGNHTDHQRGRVLAAAVDLETTAKVTLNHTEFIRVFSEGYAPVEISLDDLVMRPEEVNTTAALVRGIAAAFVQRGAVIQGFDAYVQSTVLPGSGLSSSAAFEVLMGTILNTLFLDSQLTPVQIAQIGQWAENVYFGKPCGLMDQTASAVGGLVFIDFADLEKPVVKKVDYDFAKSGHALCIIDSGANHADLTEEYAAIPGEMKAVAAQFGAQVLTQVAEQDFYAKLPQLRKVCGDRAVLRCIHFYEENARVLKLVSALENDDFEGFLQLIRESGQSSYMYLQNVIPVDYVENQDVAVALALCQHYLQRRGAFRVHGGGFAGTVQAFVPFDLLESFKSGIEDALGEGSCHVLSIRSQGSILI